MRDNKDLRIFFALWPDAVIREQLSNASNSIPVERPARRVPDYNLHLTLHFIGNVYQDQLVCMQQQASLVEAEGFELDIDCQGHFSKPRVAWLGCSGIPARCGIFTINWGKAWVIVITNPSCGVYHPHITVARKIKSIAACGDFEPMRWRVENFVLVESRSIASGVKYRVIDSYDLT